MGSIFGKPKIPEQKMPPRPPELDRTAENAANFERQRRLAAFGKNKTVLTGRGLSAGMKKTLLGS